MNIFISRKISESATALLKNAGHKVVEYLEKKDLSQEELIHICQDYDALLSVGPNKLNETFFNACKHLKGVALMSAGYDNLDVAAATDHHIPVSNTPGVLSKATADVAFLLMLAVSRNAFFSYNRIVNGDWNFYEPTLNLGIELEGKTLGIFGLGRIGMELAHKCKSAYNMQIIYHNRSRNNEAERLLDAHFVPFDDLLAESDVISLHANLSPETKGVFDKAAFNKMKPSSIFINTARGAMHNEADLIEALQSKKIWGTGLDVTNPEPMAKDNVLLTMPNVCVLPHIGSATVETRGKMADMAAGNILAALNGMQMPQCLNPSVYDK